MSTLKTSASWLAALLALVSLGSPQSLAASERVAHRGTELLPDAIAGKGKVFVLPVLEGRPDQILDPQGYSATFRSAQEPSREQRFDCGVWLEPERGTVFEVWLEGDGFISPYAVPVTLGEPDDLGQVVLVPVVAAGRVKLDVVVEPGLEIEAHVWSLGPFRDRNNALQGEIVRRAAVGLEGAVLAMPPGRVIVGEWSVELQRYLTLSPAVEVKAGETTRIDDLEFFSTKLVLELSTGTIPPEEVEIQLEDYDMDKPADVTVFARERIFAFWHQLLGGKKTLSARGGGLVMLPAANFDLGFGVAKRVQGRLTEPPVLEVELVLPPELANDEVTLQVNSRGRYHTHQKATHTGNARHVFRNLPLEPLELRLETRLGDAVQEIDTWPNANVPILFEPVPYTLEGRVRYGGRPSKATLRFRPEVVVETDADGAYRVELLGDLKTVVVKIDGRQGDPHWEMLDAPINASGRLDLDIPAGQIGVRVLDAATRAGIEEARVELVNVWALPGEPVDTVDPRRLRWLRQRAETDASGLAGLPPIRPGRLQLSADAEGYLQSTPIVVEVEPDAVEKEVEIALERFAGEVELRLTLADGSPADRARVGLFDAESHDQRWQGRANQEGVITVPLTAAASDLLVTHSKTAFLTLRWPLDSIPTSLPLPPPAAEALGVSVVDAAGQAIEGVEIALVVDGRTLRGGFLGFAIEHPPATNRLGLLPAFHLPPRNVKVLAYSPWNPTEPLASAEVAYPWAGLVELRLPE